jgi:effector-binding domain-containing protein
MGHEVHTEQAEARQLAAIRTSTTRDQLGADIVRALDKVWPVLREQQVRTGHNVIVYRGADGTTLDIEVGVEALSEFTGDGEIRATATPSGEVATTAHYGEYSKMAPAYAALEQWCHATGRRATGVSWEVYGDWDEDPAKVRTDLFILLEPQPDR